MSKKTRSIAAYVTFALFVMVAVSAFVFRYIAVRQFDAKVAAMGDRDKAIMGLIDSTNHGFAILSKKGLVTEWNPALERWTGYTSAEMIGTDITRLMDDKAAVRHEHEFAAALASVNRDYETQVVDCQIQPKDKAAKPVDVRVSVRVVHSPDSGNEPYAIATIDLPERIVEIEAPKEAAKP